MLDPNYFPKVIQAVPADDYKVYAYFDDGSIKLYDVSPLINKGVFKQIADPEIFKSTITVLNNTVAWDLSGKHDPADCIDIDPLVIYKSPSVPDPLK